MHKPRGPCDSLRERSRAVRFRRSIIASIHGAGRLPHRRRLSHRRSRRLPTWSTRCSWLLETGVMSAWFGWRTGA